jgi:predicted ribosome quality control (RQC) complex YloA/Tae2 family protein
VLSAEPGRSPGTATCSTKLAAPQTQPRHLQPVDYTTLSACVAELNQRWVPAKIERALQVDSETVVLQLRTLESNGYLYVSWRTGADYIGIGAAPTRGNIAEAFGFGEQLDAAVRGLVLTDVTLPQWWERVVRFSLAPRLDAAVSVQLYCEIMGRYSNLVVCNGSNHILASGFQVGGTVEQNSCTACTDRAAPLQSLQVGGKMSSLRQVQTGRQYELPPPAPGVDPDSCSTATDWRLFIEGAAELVMQKSEKERVGTLIEGWVRAFRGISPSLVRELCSIAEVQADAPISEVEAEAWDRAYGAWGHWLQRLRSKAFQPSWDTVHRLYSAIGTYDEQLDSTLEFVHQHISTATNIEVVEQARCGALTVLPW